MFATSCGGPERADTSAALAIAEAEPPARSAIRVPAASSAAPRIVLLADGASRLDLLNSLAESERFSLSGPTDGLGVASASMEGDRVETVLAALLHDIPYSLHYRSDGPDARVRLAELALRPLAAAPGDAQARAMQRDAELGVADRRAGARAQAAELAARIGSGTVASAGDLEARLERVRESEALAREEALLHLESEDPLERQFGVSALDPASRSDARRLGDLALRDPDPRVRLEAVEQLGFGDPRVAIPILTEAALDSDESVAKPAREELDHATGQLTNED